MAINCFARDQSWWFRVKYGASARHRAFTVKLVRGLMQYASAFKVGLRVDATVSEHKAFCMRIKRAARRWLAVVEGKR